MGLCFYFRKEREDMKKMDYIKAIVAIVTGWLSAVLGILYVPVLIMVACNVLDYFTGLMAAKNRKDGKISSYRSIRGIQKKITMWLLVIVGGLVDQLLIYASEVIGYRLPFTFLVACIVAIWIICNELISILENIVDIGVNIPAFLMPMICKLKTTIDQMGGDENK